MTTVIDGNADGVQIVRSAVHDADDSLGVALVGYGRGIGEENAERWMSAL